MSINSSSADAHSALGVAELLDWGWLAAEQEFRRAVALNPNNAQAHKDLCDFLEMTGADSQARPHRLPAILPLLAAAIHHNFPRYWEAPSPA